MKKAVTAAGLAEIQKACIDLLYALAGQ